MEDKCKKSMTAWIDMTAKEFLKIVREMISELGDAADDIANGDIAKENLIARLRSRAQKFIDEEAALANGITPLIEELTGDLERLDKRAWRLGFAASLRLFAHWHDGEQQVGSTGKTLRQALDELAAGKYDTEYIPLSEREDG